MSETILLFLLLHDLSEGRGRKRRGDKVVSKTEMPGLIDVVVVVIVDILEG